MLTESSRPSALFRAAFALCLLCLAVTAAADDGETQACADSALKLGFYAYFPPVSYSADADPESEAFHEHRGYEADLLSALEAMAGAGLAFRRIAIPLWDEIWLRAASPEFDIIGGGITRLDSRRFDEEGQERIAFTAGHIQFRQSLLTRADDAERLRSYRRLNSDTVVGVLPGTTGEFRLLQLTGWVDEAGVLAAGAEVETASGTVTTDGSTDYVLSPAAVSPVLAQRRSLHPPAPSLPRVIYLGGERGESELLEALAAGEIDAVARGEAGNRDAVRATDGALAVAALDEEVEYGGFALDVDAVDLRVCLDERINWLTDGGEIAYADWLADADVFLRRAALWDASAAQPD